MELVAARSRWIFDVQHRPAVRRRRRASLRVHDVDAARAELEAKGVAFDGDTIVTGVCTQAWFKDPDGNALMLHRRFDV